MLSKELVHILSNEKTNKTESDDDSDFRTREFDESSPEQSGDESDDLQNVASLEMKEA